MCRGALYWMTEIVKEGGRTGIADAPFLRETSADLEETDSGSTFPLSFLSSTAGESRSIPDREDCNRDSDGLIYSVQSVWLSEVLKSEICHLNTVIIH